MAVRELDEGTRGTSSGRGPGAELAELAGNEKGSPSQMALPVRGM